MLSILELSHPSEVSRTLQEIGVDPYGVKLMAPKGVLRLVHARNISNIAGNIIKQEMLGLGGDAAVCRGALTGAVKKTDCVLMGTLSQFGRLMQKLKAQPFGLSEFSRELAVCLGSYGKRDFFVPLPKGALTAGNVPLLMGIVNVTPDSFSGDGIMAGAHGAASCSEQAITQGLNLVRQGAQIIDVGGESTRPGSREVSVREEIVRVIPVIEGLRKRTGAPLSVDTSKPEVARLAVQAGAAIINDITGMRQAAMRAVAAKSRAAVVVMHMQGTPRTMQKNPRYRDLIPDLYAFFSKQLGLLEDAGIAREKVILDPGIGFGKTAEHNFSIIRNLPAFRPLGCPILLGPSRKSFIGTALSAGPEDRVMGTAAACIEAWRRGASILRVHDVKAVRQALAISQKVENA